MSPILVRPVREQLEHDRVIRLLQAKYKKKFEVAINPGNEQTAPVGTGSSPWYPDLVLQSTDRNRKLLGVVEVETVESVNNLEAMSQWAAFGRLKVPFHLYLPTGCIDTARRFCTDLSIQVAELWAYQTVGDQLRFSLVHRVPQPGDGKAEGRAKGSDGVAKAKARPRAAAAARRAGGARPAAAVSGRRSTTARTRPAATRSSRAAPAAPGRRPAVKAKALKAKSPRGSSRAAKRR